MPFQREELKQMAIEIVKHVEPDDVFVIDDGFDALVDNWHQAVAQDEGRFIGGTEVATFAAAVVPFLLTFLGDVVKDVVKDQAKKGAGPLIDKLLQCQATGDEAAKLKTEIDLAIVKSKISRDQKAVLSAGFDKLFSKLKPAG